MASLSPTAQLRNQSMPVIGASRPLRAAVFGVVCASLFSGLDMETGVATVRFFDIALLLMGSYMALQGLSSRHAPVRLPMDGFFMALYAYLIFRIGFAGLTAPPKIAIRESIQTVEVLVLALSTRALVYHRQDFDAFIKWYGVTVGLIALVAVAYHFSVGVFSGFKQLDETKLAFGIIATLALVSAIATPSGKAVSRQWPLLAFWLLLMLLSGERKGWVSFLVSLLLATWFLVGIYSKRILLGATMLMLAIVFILPVVITQDYVARQISSFGEIAATVSSEGVSDYEDATTRSNQSRIFLLDAGITVWRENPWLGHGIDSFKVLMAREAPVEFLIHGAHNEYLRALVETGIIGLGAYLSVVVMALLGMMQLRARARRARDPADLIRATRMAALLGYGVVINFFLGGGFLNAAFLITPAVAIWTLHRRLRMERC